MLTILGAVEASLACPLASSSALVSVLFNPERDGEGEIEIAYHTHLSHSLSRLQLLGDTS